MSRSLPAYAAALACMLALDSLWLILMMNLLYRPLLAPLLSGSVMILPAAIFYLLYTVGVVRLAVLSSASPLVAVGRGALLGLVAYGTYDLTNQATMKNWPLAVTAADMAWGTVLTAGAALAGYAAGRRR